MISDAEQSYFQPVETSWPEPVPFPFKPEPVPISSMPAPFPFKPVRRRLVCDTECVRNYWLLKFMDVETREVETFAMWPGSMPLDIPRILQILQTSTIITFNGVNYDCPMIAYALCGASCSQLKDANDCIITQGMKYWDFYNYHGCELPAFVDHIDIMEVAPGVRISLKMYMGHIHSRKMQSLPFDPAAIFTPWDRVQTAVYCENDLVGTLDLYRECLTRIELREELNRQYAHNDPDRRPFDVRSKSDAQIAEAVIVSQLGFKPQKRVVPHGFSFYYKAPSFVTFRTKQLQDVLDMVQSRPFIVSKKKGEAGEEFEDYQGKKIKTGILMPKDIAACRIAIGTSTYKFGIGGLHSQEKNVNWHADENYELWDDDVTGYYPSLMLLLGTYPENCGLAWLTIFGNIKKERDAAKAAKRKREADSKKIVGNGAFGKYGSEFSAFYAPEHLINVTITGQLCLLMLIERLEAIGVQVISANTDGIVKRVPKGWQGACAAVIKQWEVDTGLSMERTHYSDIYSASVNSYLAFTLDGEVKKKGLYTEPGLGVSSSKAPDRTICADAVIAFLKDFKPLHETIRGCKDIRRFITVKKVQGGAVKRRYSPIQLAMVGSQNEPFEQVPELSDYLGSAIRFVYKRGETLPINYITSGNMVQLSMGAEPVMELPPDYAVPDWIDYQAYEQCAVDMLAELNVDYPMSLAFGSVQNCR